ncbi:MULTISPECIES: metallophosphoesterase [unclassified Pseudomonas]|uniref:metallophosphoesterase n=1 Tax=unclassified Pseudomonas TaxID=196821 RepID=UPI002449B1C1|nr:MULTISPECIES: metallophosphoesterase [unclassified Pseudomonas]MDG9922641.1 metallophosphoesterase [Pseudomonas sp. GD04045]MDH0033226.1 metallophosphoesterase [Pseudomonas sp. GD04019]
MNINWLHISDIHFHPRSQWRDNQSIDSLLEYLSESFSKKELPLPDLIFCTGDIAFGESSNAPLHEQYSDAENFFNKLLNACGKDGKPLAKERLFIVPGNHDINRNKINQDAQETLIRWAGASHQHIDKINQRFQDKSKEFLTIISRLDEYGDFVKNYLPHQHDPEGRHRYSKTININDVKIGVSGFNSAWTCSGPEDDRNLWLAANWQFNKAQEEAKGCDIKIGLIHHPTDWLNNSDRNIATASIPTKYDFWLHGHSHNAWVTPSQNNIMIAAGAVGASSSEEFGVNLVSLDFSSKSGVVHLLTKKAGCDWTIQPIPQHAPFGKWEFNFPSRIIKTNTTVAEKQKPSGSTIDAAITEKLLATRLKEALKLFSNHTNEWIAPTISTEAENGDRQESATFITPEEITKSPRDLLISAPPQHGLTCLSHYLIHDAWTKQNTFWLYLDARNTKPHREAILKQQDKELQEASRQETDISCVVLDSWSPSEKDGIKLLNKIYETYPNIPIICMQQTTNSLSINQSKPLARTPENLYLWSLPRESIRKIVSLYNDKKTIGDENSITTRIISDMEVLNLHRTALNCLTLLKVSEIDFDENPVNRTEIIKRVLFLLFNIDDIPTYKSKPDLKDCEHALGYFCEQLIKDGAYGFTRSKFLTEINDHARSQLMDIETQVVFDVLYENNIIAQIGDQFYFRFSYWLFYFAAQRMHHSKEFADYIFEDMRYSQYPELIEFYTGIDRRREDALSTLTEDLKRVRLAVHDNCGLPEDLNPYRLGKWNSSEETKEIMQQEVANGVAESNLPEIIKDRYADKNYDCKRPYNQTFGSVLSEHHFVRLVQATSAGSRALRNSDYANIDLKKELLSELLKCWDQISRVIFTILPMLMENKSATYDGVHIILLGEQYGNTLIERFSSILTTIPSSVSRTFSDDLFSMKMGPLFYDQLKNTSITELSKHTLILLLISKRPRDWHKEVSKYISQVQHNSFYLFDIYTNLRSQYRYSFASTKVLGEIEYLIKMAAAKHSTGSKTPNSKMISKINPKVIPDRESPSD